MTLEELSVKNGEAKLLMSYASLNYFLEFQGADFNIKHLAIMSRENAVKNYNIVNLVDPAGEPVELTTALSNAKVKVLVTLVDENGQERLVRVEDDWLYANGIDERSCWPDEVRVNSDRMKSGLMRPEEVWADGTDC